MRLAEDRAAGGGLHHHCLGLAGMVVGCMLHRMRRVIMGWLMIGPAGPDHLLQPLRLLLPADPLPARRRDGSLPQLLGPVGADRHLAAHRLQLQSRDTGWTGDPDYLATPVVTALTAAVADPGGGRRRYGGLLPAALAGGVTVLLPWLGWASDRHGGCRYRISRHVGNVTSKASQSVKFTSVSCEERAMSFTDTCQRIVRDPARRPRSAMPWRSPPKMRFTPYPDYPPPSRRPWREGAATCSRDMPPAALCAAGL